MRIRFWSNAGSGTAGETRRTPAGMVLLGLLVGVGCAVWATQGAPLRYRAVLEGKDKRGHYFTTLAIASPSRWQARWLALGAAKRHGLDIVRVEEMEATGPAPGHGRLKVLKAPWDRTYIPDDPDEPAHRH